MYLAEAASTACPEDTESVLLVPQRRRLDSCSNITSVKVKQSVFCVKVDGLSLSADQSELMAEISIGAGIHPRRETMKGRAAICQGVFSTKSELYSDA